MKTELRLRPHTITPSSTIVEVWHEGRFLATITGADGPGVRIITKHLIKAVAGPDDGSGIGAVEVKIEPGA